MEYFFVYLLGIMSGFGLAIIYGIILANSDRKNLQEKTTKFVDELKKEMIWASAKERFDKALAISHEQSQMISKIEGPSRGALYSKWRNDTRSQLLALEREKMDIFRSIIADGLDPLVSVMGDDGEVVKKKMSETVAEFDAHFPKDDRAKAPVAVKPQPPALKIVKNTDNQQK